MIEDDRVSNEDGLDVARVRGYEDKVQQWSYDEGAEDVLVRLCNGQLL